MQKCKSHSYFSSSKAKGTVLLLASVSLKRLWRKALDGDFDAFGTALGVDEKSKAGFACPPALTLVGLSGFRPCFFFSVSSPWTNEQVSLQALTGLPVWFVSKLLVLRLKLPNAKVNIQGLHVSCANVFVALLASAYERFSLS